MPAHKSLIESAGLSSRSSGRRPVGYATAMWLSFGEALAAVAGALTCLLFVAVSVKSNVLAASLSLRVAYPIHSSGQVVQDRPGVSALWVNVPSASVHDRCRPATWQQWSASRHPPYQGCFSDLSATCCKPG
jgi:hypothetical protein